MKSRYSENSKELYDKLYDKETMNSEILEINGQPERSKREDLIDLDIKILDRALKRAHREGAWDQDDYDDFDQMYLLVQKYKDAVL